MKPKEVRTPAQYFAARLQSFIKDHDGTLEPGEYNVVFKVLDIVATTAASSNLVQLLGSVRLLVNRRQAYIAQSVKLNRLNQVFRNELMGLITELEKAKGEDPELNELHLLLSTTRRTIGIPENRTTPFRTSRVTHPVFLFETVRHALQVHLDSTAPQRKTAARG